MSDLRSDLLAVGGVASVLVEEADGAPISASLRLVDDADEVQVADQVGAVLARYGLKSRDNQPEASTVNEEPTQTQTQEAEPAEAQEPDTQSPPPQEVDLTSGRAQAVTVESISVSPARVIAAEIEQNSQGLLVRVTLQDGRSGEQVVVPGGDQIRMAVVSIVGVLLGVVGARLQQYKVEEFTGRRAVTVIVSRGGEVPGIGTAFEAGTVFEPGTVELAIAKAAWAAVLS